MAKGPGSGGDGGAGPWWRTRKPALEKRLRDFPFPLAVPWSPAGRHARGQPASPPARCLRGLESDRVVNPGRHRADEPRLSNWLGVSASRPTSLRQRRPRPKPCTSWQLGGFPARNSGSRRSLSESWSQASSQRLCRGRSAIARICNCPSLEDSRARQRIAGDAGGRESAWDSQPERICFVPGSHSSAFWAVAFWVDLISDSILPGERSPSSLLHRRRVSTRKFSCS